MLITFDMFSPGTEIFDQIRGVRFPSTPRINVAPLGTLTGNLALENTRPGEEFNPEPLPIEFSAQQSLVRFTVGLNQSSVNAIQATLRAFDVSGNSVAQDGPIALGPGPTAIRTIMQVRTASRNIARVVLEYTQSFVEVIGSLEFNVVGPREQPDRDPPIITIIQPANGATLTGETFRLEIQIREERKLRSVNVTIENPLGSQSSAVDFYGLGPDYSVGPLFFGSLAEGSNTVTVRAEDFGGNVAVSSVSVTRVPIAGQLTIPPIFVVPRVRPVVIPIDLQETFPGSLAGRGDITIRLESPQQIFGEGLIRDYLNQPVPHLDLAVRASRTAPLGKAQITVEAVENASGRILSTIEGRALVTPGRPINCPGQTLPFYTPILLGDVTRMINNSIDGRLGDVAPFVSIEKLSDMAVRYNGYFGSLSVSQRYLARVPIIEAEIHFYGELAPRLTFRAPHDIFFDYLVYEVNAAPNTDDPILFIALQDAAESLFTDNFKEPFRRGLGDGLTASLDTVDPAIRILLQDIYISNDEFGLGFCSPF